MADMLAILGVLVSVVLCVAILVKLNKKGNKVGRPGYVQSGCAGLDMYCPYGMDGCILPCEDVYADRLKDENLGNCCFGDKTSSGICPRDSHGFVFENGGCVYNV